MNSTCHYHQATLLRLLFRFFLIAHISAYLRFVQSRRVRTI